MGSYYILMINVILGLNKILEEIISKSIQGAILHYTEVD